MLSIVSQGLLIKSGDVPKWLKGLHSKCSRHLISAREFESLHLRQWRAATVTPYPAPSFEGALPLYRILMCAWRPALWFFNPAPVGAERVERLSALHPSCIIKTPHPASGRVTVKAEPSPRVLSREMLPWWHSTRCLAMDSPSPVPPVCLERLLSTR